MSKNIFSIAALVILLAICGGCSTRYTIATTNGSQVTTKGKPRYDKSTATWWYKDMSGQQRTISGGSVTEVAPQSMMSKDESPANYSPAAKK